MSKCYIPKKPPEWVLNRIRNDLALHPTLYLVWTEDKGRVKAGDKAGSKVKRGHWHIGFGIGSGKTKPRIYKNVRVHHIVWYLVTGEWPSRELDHIDHNESNNAFGNLRLATHSENNRNRPAQSNNKLGIKNVYIDGRGKFNVAIKHHGQKVVQKRFKSLDAALTARDEALAKYHGEFACK